MFPKIGVGPQNGWFTMETLVKWMIWGYPYVWKHPYIYIVPKLILPETNIEFTPKNLWLEDEVPLGKLYFFAGVMLV